jgi:sugar lactone lactonase YvrE
MKRTEHTTKTPFAATGFFATLCASLNIQGSGAPRGPARAMIAYASIALLCLALGAAPAFAGKQHVPGVPSSFGPEGEGTVNGELFEPGGVAVNEVALGELGDVYVIDRDIGNYSIAYFSSAGVERGRFEAPPEGFGESTAIAVDNSTDPLDSSAGDVYVADSGRKVIDKFSATGVYIGQLTETTGGSPFGLLPGLAVDASGDLWVYEEGAGLGVVDEFTDTGGFVKAFKTEQQALDGIAVDSSGNVYVTGFLEGVGLHVLKFDGATGTKLAQFGERAERLAIDPSTENLLVGIDGAIALYAPNPGSSSTPIETFPSPPFHELRGMAVNGQDTVYAADRIEGGNQIKVFDYVLFPDVAVEAASSVAQVTATLNGTVNPDEAEAASPGEAALTGCRFEYGTEAGSLTNSAECSPAAAAITGEQHVSAHLSGLQGGTVYHYRLSASNERGTEHSQELELLTAGPGIAAESVSDVASTSATLEAEINPNEAPTKYYFQYSTTDTESCVSSPSSCTAVPVQPGEAIGSGEQAVHVSQQVQGLLEDTVYHYRVVAVGEPRPERFKTLEGPDQTFTTQGSGGTLVLPDGRQWELVSPASKLGTQATTEGLIQPSEDGSAIAYPMSGPFVATAPGNVQISQALSRRGPDGWSTEDIATPHTGPAFINASGQEYQLFSSDLSHGLVEPLGETPLSPEATEKTPYVRDDATGVYTPLVDPEDVPAGTEFGGPPDATADHRGPKFMAASPDLKHVVLVSFVALTTTPANTDRLLFYEWTAGRLQLIDGSLPGGAEPSGPGPTIGGAGDTRGAVSDDGSRVFWSTFAGHLYMTDMTTGEVLQVDKAQGVAEPAEAAQARFQIASGDGAAVFFSDKLQLTPSSGGGLYRYDVQTGKLTLVTAAVNSGEEAGVQGLVLGASEDGSYVYLVATGVLTDTPNAEQQEAVAGAENLYVLHRQVHGSTEEWAPSFIAVLSASDKTEWEPFSVPSFDGGRQTVEVSRSGRYLAFMSDRSLTGYDNRDVSSGEPDEEVYRYDAAGAQLECASCDPTGARPAGWLEPQKSPLSDPQGAWRGHWVAATIPAAIYVVGFYDAIPITPYEKSYMLDSGRLFFDSHDSLVPQDVNGVGDVYEYEPGGTGSCAAETDGCVALLSSGAGADESALAGASASGNDVFLLTSDRLVSQDVGHDYDMYDARVCTTEAPCSSSAVTPPPCSTTDSCKGALTPQPGVFGAPASATFSGVGNIAPAPTTTVKSKAKPLTRAQRLAQVRTACRKKWKHAKKRRAACEKQAEKRYGPLHKAKNAGAERRAKS